MESARSRALLNNAAQEISTLQREVWQLERQLNWERRDRTSLGQAIEHHPAAPSSVETGANRPIYAVNPIGRIDAPQAEQQFRSELVVMHRFPMVTNLGTLVDVLA